MDTTPSFKAMLERSTPFLKHVWLFSLLFLCSSALLSQQRFNGDYEPVPDVNRIYLKLNPFPILTGPIPLTSEYRLGFEIVAGKRFTYQISGSYLGRSILFNTQLVPDSTRNTFANYQFPGYRVQLQMKYYYAKFTGDKDLESTLLPTGLYVSLHSSYAAATLQDGNNRFPRQEWSNFTINALGGMQVMLGPNIGLDVFSGFGWKENTAIDIDYLGRKTTLDLEEVLGEGLGTYMSSNFKFSLGFNFTFSLF